MIRRWHRHQTSQSPGANKTQNPGRCVDDLQSLLGLRQSQSRPRALIGKLRNLLALAGQNIGQLLDGKFHHVAGRVFITDIGQFLSAANDSEWQTNQV
jgi:hypothetical protein